MTERASTHSPESLDYMPGSTTAEKRSLANRCSCRHLSALIPASHRLNAWLGGAPDGEDSFPLTDGEHLPADRMFFAALTSLIMRVTTRAAHPGPCIQILSPCKSGRKVSQHRILNRYCD
jgi:hypothetical protein